MQLEIVAPEERSPSINADLTRRRAVIQQIDMRGNNKVNKLRFLIHSKL